MYTNRNQSHHSFHSFMNIHFTEHKVCHQNLAQLYSLVSATVAASAGSGMSSTASDNIIFIVLAQLMAVASKSTSLISSREIMDSCAKCLGEIGALDPNRLSFLLSTTRPLQSAHRTYSSPGFTANVSKANVEGYLPPWNYSVSSLGLELLEKLTHVLPEDRTDRARVAIQEILKVVARSVYSPEDLDVVSDPKHRSGVHSLSMTNRDERDEFPQVLKDQLKERGIYEICEPFWRTKYAIKTGFSKRTFPLGQQQAKLEFETWLGFVCRYLSERCAGPYKELFLACRGLVRAQVDICRFLLPHLLFDVMLFNPKSSNFPEMGHSMGFSSPRNESIGQEGDT